MTVKEILLSTATCLGREDVVQYLNGDSSTSDKQTLNAVSAMVSLFNMVVGELASTFIPMTKSEKVSFSNGKYAFSSLTENAVEIVGVYDDYGYEISYKIKGEYLCVDKGSAIVTYKYLPKNYDLNDEIGYSENEVGKMTLTCGLAAEFCISEGLFNQAVMWHKRFVEGVNSLVKPKNIKIKSRCWN